MSITRVRIVRASDAFAYLPLYIAETYRLFSEVQFRERQTGGGHGPVKFNFESTKAATTGDVHAIDEMIDAVDRGELAFALADPLEIMEAKADDPSDLVILGAFLKKPPFWIVNDHEARTIDELNISNIIFYDRDTLKTGHYIGRYIADSKRLKERSIFASVHEVGQELDLLIEKKQAGLRECGALTVDLLGMSRAFHRTGLQKCKPVLRVFEQPEFQHFVTSAFITHKRVVTDAPQAARFLLAGLRDAVRMLNEVAVVAKHCMEQSKGEQFKDQLQLVKGESAGGGLTEEEGFWIARTIVQSQLYSIDFRISLEDWTNAASAGRWVVPRLDQVSKLFKAVVEPGNKLAEALEAKVASHVPVGSGYWSPPRVNVEAEDRAFKLLTTLSRISAKDKRVIRSYFRWEEQSINRLRHWADRIMVGLIAKTNEPEIFLIGGSSGSGKTFFVEQIAADHASQIRFVPINFTAVSTDQMHEKVREVNEATQPVLVMFDEIDTQSAPDSLFDQTLSVLDTNRTHKTRQIVCVLLGSAIGGSKAIVDSMKSGTGKRDDVVTRIPSDNRFDVPEVVFEDQLAVLAGQIQMGMAELSSDVRRVEKFAIYYILSNPSFEIPRHLRDMIKAAIARMNQRGATGGLCFADLFSSGDAAGHRFWSDHYTIAEELKDTFVSIE